MAEIVEFTVLGRPQPQGSIRAFVVKGKPILTSDNAKVKPWRQDAGWAAAEAGQKAGWQMGDEQKDPVMVYAKFFMAKPKSAKKSRVYPQTKPDIDKLSRALLDSMTGILFADDGQVVSLQAHKNYGLPERTEVLVMRMEG